MIAKNPATSGRRAIVRAGRQDLPYTMRLPDGQTLYVEVPTRWVMRDRDGTIAFLPAGARFLDRVRALAIRLDRPPTPGYIVSLRQALGVTQRQLGRELGVDKLTVSRWERGVVQPSKESVAGLDRLRTRCVRRGVSIPG